MRCACGGWASSGGVKSGLLPEGQQGRTGHVGNLGDLQFCNIKIGFWKGNSLSYSAAISRGSEIINLSARKVLVENIHCYELNVFMWVITFPQPWGGGEGGSQESKEGEGWPL